MAYNVSSQWWPLWCRRELCGHCSVAPLVWGQGEVLDSFQLPWGGDYPSFSSFPIPFPSYSLISVIVLGKQCIEWWSRKYSCVPHSSSSRLEYFTAKSTDMGAWTWQWWVSWCFIQSSLLSAGLTGPFFRSLLKGKEDGRMCIPIWLPGRSSVCLQTHLPLAVVIYLRFLWFFTTFFGHRIKMLILKYGKRKPTKKALIFETSVREK